MAPYDYSSGTSIRGRTGVSEKGQPVPRKSLFHTAALNAVKVPGDLQTYHQRQHKESTQTKCFNAAPRSYTTSGPYWRAASLHTFQTPLQNAIEI
ncbi:MAG: transposase, partial [Flavobacteriales bacterium]|nr:transposase [Flavobacteriales bacterium]